MNFNIYTKVLKKTSIKDNYFTSRIWIDKQLKIIKYKIRNNIISEPKTDNVLFYYLYFHKKKKIKILDWGGGFGNIFFDLKQIRKKKFSLVVYEPEKKIVESAKILFQKIQNIKFTSDINIALSTKKIDILYIGSVFQYIFCIDNFLKKIKKLNPTSIVIYDLLASSNPTYYSYQNFYGKKMQVKFYNLNFLIKKFKKYGYTVRFLSNIRREILGKLQSPPMLNFKKKYRIDFSKQIIFENIK